MSMALGNLAQELVRPYSDRYVVTSVQVGSSETGPFKDALLTDLCVILSDMGYRYLVCFYDYVCDGGAELVAEEPVAPARNAFTVLMGSPGRLKTAILPKKRIRSAGIAARPEREDYDLGHFLSVER